MRFPNGFGSVYKKKGNRRKPWVAEKTIGWTPEGKRETYVVGYFAKRPEAVAALLKYNDNPIAERSEITLAELYAEWSASKYEHGSIETSTAKQYKSAWKHMERISHLPVRELRKSHLQSVLDAMYKKDLSLSSRQKVKVVMGLLFKYAMGENIVSQNYAELLELPSEEKTEKEIFTDAEIATIERLAKTDKWANTILIMIYTGMRIGELLTLTVFHIDIDNMVIVGGIKTDAGKNRSIPIHPKIQRYIRAWYDDKKTRLIHRNGKPIRQEYYRKYLYYPILANPDNELRRLTPHAGRHTFASLLNRANANTKAQQLLLGHADYSTTANIYTHTNLTELRTAIELL